MQQYVKYSRLYFYLFVCPRCAKSCSGHVVVIWCEHCDRVKISNSGCLLGTSSGASWRTELLSELRKGSILLLKDLNRAMTLAVFGYQLFSHLYQRVKNCHHQMSFLQKTSQLEGVGGWEGEGGELSVTLMLHRTATGYGE